MGDDPADTTALVGGPIKRMGGKAKNGRHLLPHFARALVYAEPFFGAGGMFFRVPPRTYEREAVNDLDDSLVTFFRVLRDQPEELARVCEATPYARSEFAAALERSTDDLEEARRVWVRHRQGVSGAASGVGNWGRSPGDGAAWEPAQTDSKRESLPRYAARLRRVSIDCIDGVEFVAKWGQRDTFVYCDPPYVDAGDCYEHAVDHRALAAACHDAVARGAKVAVSGYPSALYDELFGREWRQIVRDVAFHGTRNPNGARRTEVLWCSYPETEALGCVAPVRDLFSKLNPTGT